MPSIYLTFDDGPNEPYTSQILNILKIFGAKATFFVCGKNAEYYPALARRIVQEGHGIGNHTFSHSKFLSYTGLWLREIKQTNKIIFKITGRKTNLFRPPWGRITPWLFLYLKIKNIKIVLWDKAVGDWKNPSPETIVKRVLEKIKPEDIILLHDLPQTVKALPLIIKELKSRGFDFKMINMLK